MFKLIIAVKTAVEDCGKYDLQMQVERCLSEDTPIPTPDQAFLGE